MKLATIYDNSEMIAVFSIEDSQYEQMLGNRDKNQAIEIPFSSPTLCLMNMWLSFTM